MVEVAAGTRAAKRGTRFDPEIPADRLGLVREIVAVANSGGGEILLGVVEPGGGSPRPAGAAFLDAAALTEFVAGYVAPDRVGLTTSVDAADGPDGPVVSVAVNAPMRPPVVFSRAGRYATEKGDVTVFERHTVVTRHGARTVLASGADHRRWIDAAVRAERARLVRVLTLAASLPPGGSIRVVSEAGEVSAEPRALLDRAVRAWRADPAKLLSRQDLLVLLLAARTLALGGAGGDLILHSALRRRATLWFWVDRIFPDPDRLASVLQDAVAGSDRDPSDAASSIVDLAALLLPPDRYREVLTVLGASRYKHFRDAAATGRDSRRTLRRLARLRNRLVDGVPLRRARESDVAEAAGELGRELLGERTANTAASRLLGALGLELMLRHHPEVATALEISSTGGEQATIFADPD